MQHRQLTAEDSLLLVVDVQEAFEPYITEMDRVVEKTRIMIEGAGLLKVPIIVTQQYPRGLGQTVSRLRDILGNADCYDKVTFSCCRDDAVRTAVQASGRPQIIVVGIEAHVCVAQTCFDLLEMNLQPYVIADAVGSRHETDCRVALRRLRDAGAFVTTTEAALMEMTVSSRHEAFKSISRLIK